MPKNLDLQELVSVSELLEFYKRDERFHMRRISQEQLLKEANVTSRMSLRSGRGFAHWIPPRNKQRLVSFLESHITEPVAKYPNHRRTAKEQPTEQLIDGTRILSSMDLQFQLLQNAIGDLQDQAEKQTKLIEKLLKSLGELP